MYHFSVVYLVLGMTIYFLCKRNAVNRKHVLGELNKNFMRDRWKYQHFSIISAYSSSKHAIAFALFCIFAIFFSSRAVRFRRWLFPRSGHLGGNLHSRQHFPLAFNCISFCPKELLPYVFFLLSEAGLRIGG